MSEKFIPEHIDPYRFADQGLSLDGAVKIADMSRLSGSLNSHEGTVLVQLQFGVDEQKLTYLKGHVTGKLTLECQRCMDPFVYEIISDFALGIVASLDEADSLPAHYEPALTSEGSLALRELIEDELILNLPIVPMHKPEDCKIKPSLSGETSENGRGENPFHVLASLKHKQK